MVQIIRWSLPIHPVSSGEVSFVASTRSEDNIFNCGEELDTVLLKLQETLVAHVVEDYLYRAAENWGFKFRTQPDTAIMPGHFRNGTNDPFLSNFFDDDQQQLDSLFDTTYLRRNDALTSSSTFHVVGCDKGMPNGWPFNWG